MKYIVNLLVSISILLSVLVWIGSMFLGYYFGDIVSIIFQGASLLLIYPLYNFFAYKKRLVINPLYYILLIGLLVFTLNTSFNILIDLFKNNETNLFNTLYLSYVSYIVIWILGIFMSKSYFNQEKNNPASTMMVISVPSIVSVVGYLTNNTNGFIFPLLVSNVIFIVSLIVMMIDSRNNNTKSDLQKKYIVLFILSILSLNSVGIILLINMYYKLNKVEK